MLLLSDDSTQGGYTVLRNGSFYRAGRLTLPPRSAGPEPYTCSAGALRLTVPGGISEVLARSVPRAQPRR